jgi:hypothetical protein
MLALFFSCLQRRVPWKYVGLWRIRKAWTTFLSADKLAPHAGRATSDAVVAVGVSGANRKALYAGLG